MKAEIQYFLRLLGAFARKQLIDPPAEVDTERLICIAQNSNLAGVLGYMLLPHTNIDETLAQRAGRLFFKTVGIVANREQATIRLEEQMKAAGISYALVKGAALSRIYPAKELRTGGDVDFVVSPTCRERLEALVAENGYAVLHTDARQLCISHPPLFVEFHFTLEADAAQCADPALRALLRDPSPYMTEWEGVQTVEPLFHFVYLLAHQQHHFEEDSPGIRSFLDLAVWLHRGLPFTTDSLENLLRQVGLYAYAQKALTLTSHWFGVQSPLPTVEIPPADIAFLETYLFDVGQFAVERNPRAKQVATLGKSGSVLRALFPPAEQLKADTRYEKLANACLPLAYVKRWFAGLRRPAWATASAKAIATATEDADAYTRVQQILDLRRKSV